jgi:hypothetical protein
MIDARSLDIHGLLVVILPGTETKLTVSRSAFPQTAPDTKYSPTN